MNENLGTSYSVIKFDDKNRDNITTLYGCIPSLREADLLAQLAMCNKEDHELIYITPGWNRSINKSERYLEEYSEALSLAKEYEAEDYIPF